MTYKLVKDRGTMENVILKITNTEGVTKTILLGRANIYYIIRNQVKTLYSVDMYDAWDIELTEEDAKALAEFTYFGGIYKGGHIKKEKKKEEVKEEPKSFWEIMTQRG